MPDLTADAQHTLTEYQAAMDAVVQLACSSELIPLDKLLATIGRAETLGPILHPTEYRAADLASQRALVEAALIFRRAVLPIIASRRLPHV